MFYGHIGVALAAKPLAPKASLGVLLIAATLADTLCGIFVILGMENVSRNGISSIPWSHGLFMSIMWSIITLIIILMLPIGIWIDRHRNIIS